VEARAKKTVTIRDARPEDAAGIAQVEVTTWRAAYADILSPERLATMTVARSEARWVQALGLPAANRIQVSLVAMLDDRVIAFVNGNARVLGTQRMAMLEMLYVLPEHQKRGIGRVLLQTFAARMAARDVTAMWLEALAKNGRARRFYKRAGGVEVDRRWAFSGTKPIVILTYAWTLPDGVRR
jgi:ribosomal protein S18 acetylase RimI-like enzyme